MTVRGSAGSVEARLAAGWLRSPCCGAVLARWGLGAAPGGGDALGAGRSSARGGAGAAAAGGRMCCCLRFCGRGGGMARR